MANSVDLDDVTSSAPTEEISSPVETEVTESEQTSEEPVEPKGEEIGNEDTPKEIDQSAEEVPGELTESQKESKVSVGGKDYSLSDVERIIQTAQKVPIYQSDRDKAEYTMTRMIKQLNEQGMGVDANMNIVPLNQPKVDKAELAQRAVSGDTEALGTLLEVQSQEIIENINQNFTATENKKQILSHIRDRYPDMYNKDGTPNMTSPISQEAAKLIAENPTLGSYENIKFVAEVAEARLLRNNMKGIKQTITNGVHQKMGKSAGSAIGKSTGTIQATPNQLSSGQRSSALKLGRDPDRISRLVEKAQKDGGYFI